MWTCYRKLSRLSTRPNNEDKRYEEEGKKERVYFADKGGNRVEVLSLDPPNFLNLGLGRNTEALKEGGLVLSFRQLLPLTVLIVPSLLRRKPVNSVGHPPCRGELGL